MDIDKYLRLKTRLINEYLKKSLPSGNQYPSEIYHAIRYSVFAGGKRIRPILTMATAELFKDNINNVLPSACAIELIHTYSLIHDDLPCMDDDDYRRGKPTNHKKFGEANAILAGNALLMLAFELISQSQNKFHIKEQIITRVLNELAHSSGFAGMVGGQMMDVESENKSVDAETVTYIHAHKTGAMICSSVRLGAILSESTSNQLAQLTRFGNALGLMFQIIDDLLDELDNRTQLKKMGKRDQVRGKATYPRIFGLNQSKQQVDRLFSKCRESLEPFGQKAERLLSITELVAKRIN
jgi:geranylgeranyl diphosphate synthase type II